MSNSSMHFCGLSQHHYITNFSLHLGCHLSVLMRLFSAPNMIVVYYQDSENCIASFGSRSWMV